MERSGVQAWLDGYVEAWRSNEAEPIEALFTDDAVYRFRPYGGEEHAAAGRAGIVESWLGDRRDDPDGWEASYEPYAVDGDRAVAVGTTRYFATTDEPERMYSNCFLLRFAGDGRCRELTEFYMLHEPA